MTTATYQDIRNKTIKWCEGLKDNGIYDDEQYNACVRSFVDMEVGQLPPEMDPPKTNNEYSYSLYDRESNYTTTNIARNNAGNVMLKTMGGMFLGCNVDGELYLTNGKDLSNQRELEWKLNFQTGDTYTIISNTGNFMGVSSNKRITASTRFDENDQEIIDNTATTRRIPIANREALDPSSIWKITKLDNRIIIESEKYRGEKITAYEPISLTKGQTEAHYWLIIDLPSKEESILPIFEPIDVHEKKNILLTELGEILKEKFIALVEIKLLFNIARSLENEYCKLTKKMRNNLTELNDKFSDRMNKELPKAIIPNDKGIYREILERKFNNKEFQRYVNDFFIPIRHPATQRPLGKLDYRNYLIFNVDGDTEYMNSNFPIKTISNICSSQFGNRVYPPISMILKQKQEHSLKLNILLEDTIVKFRTLEAKVNKKLDEVDEFEEELKKTIASDKIKIKNNNIIIERKGNTINYIESKNRLLSTKSNNLDRMQGLSEVNSEKVKDTLITKKYMLYTIYILLVIIILMSLWAGYSIISI